jgi:hypothetical protein
MRINMRTNEIESEFEMVEQKWRVVVVEDDANLRLHLVEALQAAEDFEVVGEANKVARCN